MDLNYLLHRHQISLMRATVAACAASRRAHEGFVSVYADAVARHRALSGSAIVLQPLLAGHPAG